ncbi:MAG: hypothetical protein ACTSR3_13825 [Candidatus Helarchaeota archaeon]
MDDKSWVILDMVLALILSLLGVIILWAGLNGIAADLLMVLLLQLLGLTNQDINTVGFLKLSTINTAGPSVGIALVIAGIVCLVIGLITALKKL